MMSAIPNDSVSKACSQPVEGTRQLLRADSTLVSRPDDVEQLTLFGRGYEFPSAEREHIHADAAMGALSEQGMERWRQVNIPITGRIDCPVSTRMGVIAITNRQGEPPADSLLNAQRPAKLFKQISKIVPQNAVVVGIWLEHL